MRIFRQPLVVVDTETTGLPDDPEAMPWEVAAVVLDVYGVEVDHHVVTGRPDTLEERHRSVMRRISKADPDEIAALPLLRASIHPFRVWLRGYLHRGAKITAYNIPFDREMLERVGITPYLRDWGRDIMGPGGGALAWHARSCGLDPRDLHRALADARLAGRVAVKTAHLGWW